MLAVSICLVNAVISICWVALIFSVVVIGFAFDCWLPKGVPVASDQDRARPHQEGRVARRDSCRGVEVNGTLRVFADAKTSKEVCEPGFIRIAEDTLFISADPLRMVLAQSFANHLLEVGAGCSISADMTSPAKRLLKNPRVARKMLGQIPVEGRRSIL